MDSVTQGLLGASLAQSATAKNLRLATAMGFAAGLLPDADGLIRNDSDPLLFLEFTGISPTPDQNGLLCKRMTHSPLLHRPLTP